ncbi:MAG: EFR1 family ferrodoxin [Clostridiales bacterium]|nr:EFR1 family ferrodoxin [Clostridiales bacterium]
MKIAEEIGGAEVVSVRCAPEGVSAGNAAVIGFICPVYEWDMPGAMKNFVKKLHINPNAYIFMIATYIAIHGRCFETMESLLAEKGAHLRYGYALRCVASQCTAYPPFPPEKLMIPLMEKRIQKISRDILERKNRAYPHMSAITRRLYPKLMTPYMEVEHEYDKGFYTDERCVGCATCARVCPTRNIVMEDNRPVWNHRCHGCMACVAYCPAKAIQFKTPQAYERLGTVISKRLCLPEKRKRYHNPFIRAADLMKDRLWIKGGK